MTAALPVRAFLAFGANLGDREANIRQAIKGLEATPGIKVLQVARIIESEALVLEDDASPMPPFLNTVCEIATELPPRQLLMACQSLEQVLGRQREREIRRWQPRPIDIDIILYGTEIVSEPGLEIPHPRMHLRRFVLDPLCEIAPQAWHPRLRLTAERLRSDLAQGEGK